MWKCKIKIFKNFWNLGIGNIDNLTTFNDTDLWSTPQLKGSLQIKNKPKRKKERMMEREKGKDGKREKGSEGVWE